MSNSHLPTVQERMRRVTAVQRRADDSRDLAYTPNDTSQEEYERLKAIFEPLGFSPALQSRLRFYLSEPDGDEANMLLIAARAWVCYQAHPAFFEKFLPYLGCRLYRDRDVSGRVYLCCLVLDEGFHAIAGNVTGYDTSHLPVLQNQPSQNAAQFKVRKVAQA